ncbi:cytochrome c oxidase subunit 3 [Gordonia polyisoprenivorans]|uniref:cytochrome c oxidase subunit 3 n=1 Tax=Gordonia polyisoprenivorans TaxID=84595 RepID=UPI001AD7A7E4|nr:cytochrome c oxidase subunit 3 [Gordonia polyisoprenivorans]QTI69058.1 cytochrome c oxidase subunit 3 [Gordonia polyisoprenivorans]
MKTELPDFIWTEEDDGDQNFVPRQPTRTEIPGLPGEPGLWVFIIGDMTVFGWFFLVFMWEYSHDRTLFADSVPELYRPIGVVNTLVLLFSSLFVVLGLHAHRNERPAALKRWLAGALICAFVFALLKAVEYSLEINAGHTPAQNTFFLFYFALTGIHLIHVLIGVGLLTAWWRSSAQTTTWRSKRVLAESAAVYWHMVDLLWIVIFTIVYLASTT